MRIYRKYSLCLYCLLSILFINAISDAEAQFSVDGISVVGNERIDTDAIKAQVTKKKGEISSEEVSEYIRTLYKTGFFDQVSASVVQENGNNILQFAVVEKPLVRKVFVNGNEEVDESDIGEIVKFGDKRFLDKTRIESLKKGVISYYQSKGYNEASVEHSIVPVGDNQVDITFTVKEGRRFKLVRISFRGVKEIDPDELRDAIQTKRYKWWSSWLFGTGRLNAEQLENDRTLVRQYFLDNGYIDGSVGEPQIDQDTKEGIITISFDVNEGKQYKIGQISASGDLVDGSAEKTLEDIESKRDEIFSAEKIRKDSFTVSDKFTDIGYAFANVVPNTQINREAGTVDIDFTTTKGRLVTVNQINIKGNTKTYDNVIRREVTIEEQEQYSSSKIKRSQELLQRLGYFDEVSIANAPVPGLDDKVDLNVNVRESKSTGTFSIGAGYSTSDGAIANMRITETNIAGTGRKVDFNVDVGTERNNISLGLTDRRLNDTKLSGGIELLRTERDFDDFDRLLQGGSLSFGYPMEEFLGVIAEDIGAGLRYELLDVEIENVDDDASTLVKLSEGSSVSSSIGPSLSRNTINNPLNPRTGSNQTLSYELGGLGGDAEYNLYEVRNAWYYPMFDSIIGEFIFSLRTRFSYGDSRNEDAFPLFKRFFPGGINSVRGYENRTLGPREGEDKEFGGAKQFINNAEFIFPLVEAAGLKGILFYDLGQAFDDDENVDFSELRKSWGTGIRWQSPLGPLRLEFGFPIDKQEGDKEQRFMFSFGAPF